MTAFRHGVASGDPTPRRVVIWTRISEVPRRTDSIPLEAALLDGMPHMKYLDMDSHGYSIVEVTRDQVRVEWWTVDALETRSPNQERSAAMAVRHGDPRLIPA